MIRFCLLSLFLFGSVNRDVLSQGLISLETDSLIKRGIYLSLCEFYDEALKIFVTMEEKMPTNPVGYFFHAAVLHTRMMDYERYDQIDDFEKLLKKTLKLSQRYRNTDPWADFLIGGAYGYLAFHQGKQKRLIEAFKNGQRSISALESVLARDSTLADALVGLGTYQYYRSKFSRYLSWMPFVDDSREEGISMIKEALRQSHYSKYSAMNALIWIYLDEERYDDAGDLIVTAMSEFPDSRLFLWAAARHAKKSGNWERAIDYYGRILASFEQQGVSSPYNEISCHHNLIEVLRMREDSQAAGKLCESLHEIASKELGKRDRERFDTAMELCDECCEVSRFVEAEQRD